MLEVGDKAPEFALPDQDGKVVRLTDYAGQWVVVYFYPKDDTPGCTVEACGFRDSLNELRAAHCAVVGVSQDSVGSHKKFHTKYGFNFPILSDEGREVIERYGAWQQKSRFGKKYFGIQRMTYLIDPSGTIAQIFPQVTPKGHEKEVLRAIRSLS